MHRSLIPMMVSLLLSAGFAGATDCPKQVESNPADLVQYLETQGRTADPECVTKAIGRLGEFRSPAGVPVLIDLLDFRRPDSDAERMRLFDMHDRFPAVSALFAVGAPAIPALIAKLQTGRASQTERTNGIRAIMSMQRNSPPDGVKILKKAAANAKDPEQSTQLDLAARDAAALCSEKWRSQCEDAAR
jgi:hypothetical protein